MPITSEEASKIKEHLLTQLDNFPEDKQAQIQEQINSMTTEQIETFVEQNNLNHLGGQCIFCSIIANKSPSHKIDEDSSTITILEINPESKGHALILPKEHLEELPETAKFMAQKVAKKLETKLNPDKIEINELKIMNHALLEVVPLYGEDKKRREASEEELKNLQEEILKHEELELTSKPEEVMSENIPILPPRIP
jgi:histidine triad (HIT) family protein|tara:strand:- start:66 stop:656 length:591 start_codon:yes stop_codon:yes gene_type:complete